MEQKIELKPSEELAYWIGVVQSDGSLKKYTDKKNGSESVIISLHTSAKSLSMVKKFQELSFEVLNRHTNIWTEHVTGEINCHIGVKTLLPVFEELDIGFKDPPRPPNWAKENLRYFGAYLAGLIDGDGSVRKTGKTLRIKITSAQKQEELAETIRNMFNCWVGIVRRECNRIFKGRQIHGVSYETEFNVNSKTSEFIKDFVIPWVQLTHKKEKIERFLYSKK